MIDFKNNYVVLVLPVSVETHLGWIGVNSYVEYSFLFPLVQKV